MPVIHTDEPTIHATATVPDEDQQQLSPRIEALVGAPEYRPPAPAPTDTKAPPTRHVSETAGPLPARHAVRRVGAAPHPKNVRIARAVLAVLLIVGLAVLLVPILATSAGDTTKAPAPATPAAAATTTTVRPAGVPAVRMGWPCPDSPIPGLEAFGHWYCAPGRN